MDCAICHGENGNGKGELVADMQLKIKDFTDPSTFKDKSDAEIFTMIKNGDDKLKMPAEGPRAKDRSHLESGGLRCARSQRSRAWLRTAPDSNLLCDPKPGPPARNSAPGVTAD